MESTSRNRLGKARETTILTPRMKMTTTTTKRTRRMAKITFKLILLVALSFRFLVGR